MWVYVCSIGTIVWLVRMERPERGMWEEKWPRFNCAGDGDERE